MSSGWMCSAVPNRSSQTCAAATIAVACAEQQCSDCEFEHRDEARAVQLDASLDGKLSQQRNGYETLRPKLLRDLPALFPGKADDELAIIIWGLQSRCAVDVAGKMYSKRQY